jgi:1,4-alpha-glucan branching enzyme
MLSKKPLGRKRRVLVTFTLSEPEADAVQLVGDFTDWGSPKAMRRASDGTWSVAVELPSGREYAFRYVVNGVRWENDPAADKYVPNAFGSENSVVVT